MIWNVHLICISYGILTRFKTGIHLLYFYWWSSLWIFIQVLMWYQIIIHKHQVMKYIYRFPCQHWNCENDTHSTKECVFWVIDSVLTGWIQKLLLTGICCVNLNCKVILHCNPSPLFVFRGGVLGFLRGGGAKLA